MKKLALLLLAFPLAACGPEMIYQRAGSSQYQFAVDQTACQDYAREQPPAVVQSGSKFSRPEGAVVANRRKAQTDFRSCMESKGYSVAPPPSEQAAYIPPNSLIARPYSEGPIPKPALKHIAEAEAHCRAGNIGPSDPGYGQCVNDYLQAKYQIMAFRDATGTLQVAHYTPPAPATSIVFGVPQ